MKVESISNSFTNIQKPYFQSNSTINRYKAVYKSDSLALEKLPPPTSPPVPQNPPKTNWGTIGRLGLMMAGTSAVCGGIGYAIGNTAGRAALGAGIGAGVGAVLPIAMLIYALKNFT